MKYCTRCGAEYEDAVTVCADDQNAELISAEQMRQRGLPLQEERDTRKFVPAGSVEDPLSAERITAVLTEQRIPVFARARRSGTVDLITGAMISPWWEILVPEEFSERAAALIVEVRKEVEAGAEDAARAAEEEELATEKDAGEP
jgi:hypothetical protein